jgi:hypothetical protein
LIVAIIRIRKKGTSTGRLLSTVIRSAIVRLPVSSADAEDCTIARIILARILAELLDPALSKAYDVPNSVITNGADRWCRHFIERRHCFPRSPYEVNKREGPCVPSPSGDRDGFVDPTLIY